MYILQDDNTLFIQLISLSEFSENKKMKLFIVFGQKKHTVVSGSLISYGKWKYQNQSGSQNFITIFMEWNGQL